MLVKRYGSHLNQLLRWHNKFILLRRVFKCLPRRFILLACSEDARLDCVLNFLEVACHYLLASLWLSCDFPSFFFDRCVLFWRQRGCWQYLVSCQVGEFEGVGRARPEAALHLLCLCCQVNHEVCGVDLIVRLRAGQRDVEDGEARAAGRLNCSGIVVSGRWALSCIELAVRLLNDSVLVLSTHDVIRTEQATAIVGLAQDGMTELLSRRHLIILAQQQSRRAGAALLQVFVRVIVWLVRLSDHWEHSKSTWDGLTAAAFLATLWLLITLLLLMVSLRFIFLLSEVSDIYSGGRQLHFLLLRSVLVRTSKLGHGLRGLRCEILIIAAFLALGRYTILSRIFLQLLIAIIDYVQFRVIRFAISLSCHSFIYSWNALRSVNNSMNHVLGWKGVLWAVEVTLWVHNAIFKRCFQQAVLISRD